MRLCYWLFLTTLSYVYLHCEPRCTARSTFNYTLEVLTDVKMEHLVLGATVTLTCRTAHSHRLLPHQYLQWKEGGLPVGNSTNRDTTSLLIRNISRVHYGRYTCRCMNGADNITRNLEEDLPQYQPHCSEAYSLELLPQRDVIINNCFLHKGMDYELHKACSRYTSAGQVQYVKIDKHGIEDSVDTINLTEPSDQAKFLCLNNSTLVEIVYVMIKGYKHPVFLLPPRDGHVILMKGSYPDGAAIIPFCAAYGSVQLVHGPPCGFGPFCLDVERKSNNVSLYSGLVPDTSTFYDTITCRFEENVILNYTVKIPNDAQNRVCVDASADNGRVLNEGDNVLIKCSTDNLNTNGVLLKLIHILPNGSKRHLKSTSNIGDCTHFIHNATVPDSGEYRCVAKKGTDVETDLLYITVLSPSSSKNQGNKNNATLTTSLIVLPHLLPTISSLYMFTPQNTVLSPTSSKNQGNKNNATLTTSLIVPTISSLYMFTPQNTVLSPTPSKNQGTKNNATLPTSPIVPTISSFSVKDTSKILTLQNVSSRITQTIYMPALQVTKTSNFEFLTLRDTSSRTLNVFTPQTTKPISSTSELAVVTYSVVATLVLLLFLLISLLVVVGAFLSTMYCKHTKNRNQTSCDEENKIEDNDSASSVCLSVSLPSSPTNSVLHLIPQTFPAIRAMSTNMTKISLELISSPWYIPFARLQILEEIGSGAFGLVRKAKCMLSPGEDWNIVAVKSVKEFSTEEEERDIIYELRILQYVGYHPNIVSLLGASVRQGQLLVIVEYCSGGNLLEYLRNKRHTSPSLTIEEQLDMCLQVSRGMEYLAFMKCVHRDLAARNILISHDHTLKVADFGLARELYHYEYKKSTKGKIPFKWMALESILDRLYTMKSDVWSFGILMWEIMTLGRSPYAGKSAEQLIKDLQHGYRLEKPENCPYKMYQVMKECWAQTPFARPSFEQLCNSLNSMLEEDFHDQTCFTMHSCDERKGEISDDGSERFSSCRNGETISIGSYCLQEKYHQKQALSHSSSAPYLSVQPQLYLQILPDNYKGASCPSNLHTLNLQSLEYTHAYTPESSQNLCCICPKELRKYANVNINPLGKSVASLCSTCNCELLQNVNGKATAAAAGHDFVKPLSSIIADKKEEKSIKGKEIKENEKAKDAETDCEEDAEMSEEEDSNSPTSEFILTPKSDIEHHGSSWLLDTQPYSWRTHLKTFRMDSNDSGIRMHVHSDMDSTTWSELDDSGSVFTSTEV